MISFAVLIYVLSVLIHLKRYGHSFFSFSFCSCFGLPSIPRMIDRVCDLDQYQITNWGGGGGGAAGVEPVRRRVSRKDPVNCTPDPGLQNSPVLLKTFFICFLFLFLSFVFSFFASFFLSFFLSLFPSFVLSFWNFVEVFLHSQRKNVRFCVSTPPCNYEYVY